MPRLFVFLLICIAPLCFSQPHFITVGFIERPPTIFKNADGSLRGELGSKLLQIFEEAKLRADFLPTQTEEIDSFVTIEGRDALLVTPTLVRQKDQFLMSEKPLLSLQFYAYHNATTPAIDGFDGLSNRPVVIPIAMESIRGPLKEALTDQSLNIQVVTVENDFATQLDLLRRGRADYAISYFSPSNIAMMFSNRIRQRNVIASELFTIPMYLAVRKSTPNAQDIVSRINTAMQ